MAATNYTPIQLYRTTTAAAVPSAANLAAGELAINLTDEKLYFKNAGGTVTLLASSASASNVGTVTSVAASGGTTGLTFSGSPITSSGTLTLGGTLGVANGGTGATSLTSGYLVKGNGTSAASASVVYDDGTNVGIGTITTSSWRTRITNTTNQALSLQNSSTNGTRLQFLDASWGAEIEQNNGALIFKIGGTTEGMRLDNGGNLGVGTTSPAARLHAVNSGLAGQLRLQDVTTDATVKNGVMGGAHYTNAQAPVLGMWISSTSTSNVVYVGGGLGALNAATSIQFFTAGSNTTATGTLQAAITSAGYLEATYSDKVVALGNSGTATTINLAQGNVFTATLTGNCTFTLSGANASSSRGSSFTLILTNDGTAGRTVAWAGGNFRFPGGAAALSRTTTANATDIWVFFTPDNGTTWYGNISMKDMKA